MWNGVGPFKHDDPRDRPVEVFGGDVTLHTVPERQSYVLLPVFFFKQQTAYEISSRDWSSDVCSSDLSSLESSVFCKTITATSGAEQTARFSEMRSEERRVGKECGSLWRSRGSPEH